MFSGHSYSEGHQRCRERWSGMASKKTIIALRDKSVDELRARERDLREQLFKLRFQRATGRVENPMKMRQVRREIAQILTLLHARGEGDLGWEAVAVAGAASALPGKVKIPTIRKKKGKP